MSGQLRRYFGATLAFGFAAVWSGVGLSAGLICLAAAAGGYLASVVLQRQRPARLLATAPRQPRREPGLRAASRRGRPVSKRPQQRAHATMRPAPETGRARSERGDDPVSSEYGW
jgi:hypothetical protein